MTPRVIEGNEEGRGASQDAQKEVDLARVVSYPAGSAIFDATRRLGGMRTDTRPVAVEEYRPDGSVGEGL